MTLAKAVTYFGQPAVFACDGQCDKAWGKQSRTKIRFDPDDDDDFAYLADGELGTAR